MLRLLQGFLVLSILGLAPHALFAQEQNFCTQNLKQAHALYDEGRINEVPSLLDSCLAKGFSRSEKIQAYRLLILCYLFQDEDEKAETNLLQLLKADPEYKVNEALEPAEFVNLFNSYRTLPWISIGIVGGVNRTGVHVKQEITTDNSNTAEPTYKGDYAYQVGVSADILLKNNLQLTPAILFFGRKFQMTNEKMFSYTTLTMNESQNWIEIPVTVKYNFGKRKLVPFVHAGLSGNLFLSSKASLSRVSVDNDNDASGPSVDVSALRRKLNYAAVIGAGTRYKLGYGYLLLDVRYNMGLANVVNVENRYSNSELIYYYGHIDGDFKLNTLTISVGYFKSLYKPKKIKVNE